jgi:predicted signal transduction protein with EAL and GGDEF domain
MVYLSAHDEAARVAALRQYQILDTEPDDRFDAITRLKIDRSFMRGTPADADSAAIATAIVSMAHRLSLEVIAEGVETAQQLRFLRSIGCDAVQGFLVSRPVPASDVTGLLRNHYHVFANLHAPDQNK